MFSQRDQRHPIQPFAVLLLGLALLAILGIRNQGYADEPLILERGTEYQVGLAKIDITPTTPIRMNGFLVRKEESQGVRHPIWAKAIVIGENNKTPFILITVDTLGIPASVSQQVAKHLGDTFAIPAKNIAITATHTHTGPMIQDCAPNIFGEAIPSDATAVIEGYTKVFVEKLKQVASDAMKSRFAANLHWGKGTVTFAKNRRDKNGPIDHDLPTLIVRDLSGKLRGIYLNYACHCVTLGDRQIGGDWAGFAQIQLERQHPDVIALVSIGCAGDQNPSGEIARDRADLAETQAIEIATEVSRLLKTRLRPVEGAISAHWDSIELPLAPLPSRATLEERAKQSTPIGYHARVQLAKLDRGETLRTSIPYPIQSWHFGKSLSMVFLAGEVVSEYGLRMKSELDGHKLWVNAYANASPCYIPSEKVLKAGGYEGEGAMVYYDQPTKFASGIEQKIIDVVLEQNLRDFPPAFAPFKTLGSLPLPAEQAVSTLRTHSNLRAELVVAEPLVTSPVAVDFGPDGKVWVAEMLDYPAGDSPDPASPIQGQAGGRIRLLDSTRQDGTLDRSRIFLDGIPYPTGITVWRNGVLICAAPDILFAADTDGDGKADQVKKLFSGFGTHNFQARVNSLEYGLDGWVYGSCGLFGGTIQSFANKEPFPLGDRDFRFKPDTGEIEPAVGRTQQGRVRDDWGNWFGCNNTALCYHYPLADHYVRRNPLAPPPAPFVSVPATPQESELIPASDRLQLFKLSGAAGLPTAACGLGIYRDTLLGENYRGDAFTCEAVNLLVHRMKLSPKDSTFSGRRPIEESKQEFLASTDNWFRPVQARTAPDGSFWILDMYRYIIEHPKWIPPEDLSQVDPRAGRSMGRIYRIRPANDQPLKWPRLDRMTSKELVQALESTNGWQRDMAMQMLLWNSESDSIESLRELVQHSKLPETRMQALCVLDQKNGLSPELVLIAMHDNHPAVRRHAIRLSEKWSEDPNQSSMLAATILGLKDDDHQVRLQSVCSLGAWKAPEAAQALSQNLLSNNNDRFLEAAVLSSMRKESISDFVSELLRSKEIDVSKGASRALPVAIAMANTETANQIVTHVTTETKVGRTSQQWSTLAGLIDRIEKRPDLISDSGFKTSYQKISAILDQARVLATDENVKEINRTAAIANLNRWNSDQVKDHAILSGLLSPRHTTGIQVAAIQAIARRKENSVPSQLLQHWSRHSPQVKNAVFDALLSRKEWMLSLLEEIDKKTISIVEVDAARRQTLLWHDDEAIRTTAERVFAGKVDADRQRVLEDYSEVTKLVGNRDHGKQVFSKNCATCHRHGDIGFAVGPDLLPLASKPSTFFLQEILDPNRNLDTRYMSYTALTDSGETVTGVLVAETAAAVTLRGPSAKEQSIARDEIEELSSRRSSLMPEGLERVMSKQDLADVIAFVCGAYQPSTSVSRLSKSEIGELAEKIMDPKRKDTDRTGLVEASLGQADELINEMVKGIRKENEYQLIPWLWRVAVGAGKKGDAQVLRRLLEVSLPKVGEDLRDWQAVVIGGGIINGLGLVETWPDEFMQLLLFENLDLTTRWKQTLVKAAAMADNEKVPKGTRYDALRIVALAEWKIGRPVLIRYLSKEVDSELQMGSVSGLVDVKDPEGIQLLVKNFHQFNEANRKLAIQGLMRGSDRQLVLLDAIEAKEISADAIEEKHRLRLLRSDDPNAVRKAEQIFGKP